MYRHILIPTDGSELANRAVIHGLSLAKSIGAKITALVVEPTFNVYDVPFSKMFQMTNAFAEYAEHAKAHATFVIDASTIGPSRLICSIAIRTFTREVQYKQIKVSQSGSQLPFAINFCTTPGHSSLAGPRR